MVDKWERGVGAGIMRDDWPSGMVVKIDGTSNDVGQVLSPLSAQGAIDG